MDISEGMGSLKRFRAPSGIFNDVLPGSILEGSLSIVGGILQSVVSNAPGFIFNSTFRDPPGGGGEEGFLKDSLEPILTVIRPLSEGSFRLLA